jgi:hypothetical protein
MIIFVAASLKEIFRLKTQFPWPRPEVCKRCQSCRVWKHGFVIAYFDGFSKGILIRRFRCDDCRCVIRMRPAGYFPRFQASIETIRSSIDHKVHNGCWVDGVTRNRQQHWFRALKRKAVAFFGNGPHDLISFFKKLFRKGNIPVSRSFESDLILRF